VTNTTAIPIPPEVIEAIATRAAEIVLDKLGGGPSPWMTRREAAAYLHLPLSRLEKSRDIPAHRDGGRLLYHREELDSYFASLSK
jgi:excisionase family DNA binding protein